MAPKTKKEAVDQIRQYHFWHRCKKCKCWLNTYWDEGPDLNGEWCALEGMWSEIFQDWLPDPREVVCLRCLSEGGV